MTPPWAPQYPVSSPESSHPPIPAPDFPPFSVAQLLKTGTLLLSSSGSEFSEPVALGTAAEVARARREAMNRIGLGFMDGVDDDGLELEKELGHDPDVMDEDKEPEDVEMSPRGSGSPNDNQASSVHPPLAKRSASPPRRPSKLQVETVALKTEDVSSSEMTPIEGTPSDSIGDLSGLSARERNRLKRKRKPGNSAFVGGPVGSKNSTPQPPPPSKYVTIFCTLQIRIQTCFLHCRIRVVNDDGPKARPVKAETGENGSAKRASSEKIVIDPTKGGQVEAKEKAAQALALNVSEGLWVWEGLVNVLQIDLFR
jgi:TATA-binding protein-associated factor